MRRVSRSAITKAPGSDVCGTPILGTLRPSVTDPPDASLRRLTCTDFPVNDLAGENVAGHEDAFARSISDRPTPPDADRRVGSRTHVTVVRWITHLAPPDQPPVP